MRCARSTPRACCKAAFGEDVIASYIKLQAQAEWNEYAGHLTDWERKTTLDC